MNKLKNIEKPQPFAKCSQEVRQEYAEKAKALIDKGYPVPTNDVYQLAEIMYNKIHVDTGLLSEV